MYSIWKLSKVYLPPLKNVNRIASSRCCVRLESGPPPACRRKVVSASTQDGAAGIRNHIANSLFAQHARADGDQLFSCGVLVGLR
jgi:hypothetical protein